MLLRNHYRAFQMKTTVLFTVLAVTLGLCACEQIATTDSPTPTTPELTLVEKAKKYADEHPEIQSPVIVSKLPKSVMVSLGLSSSYNFNFDYNSERQLKTISTDTGPVFEVATDPISQKATSKLGAEQMTFQLNKEGLAENAEGILVSNGKKNKTQYFYKNGYLTGMADDTYLTTLKYSGNGNLLEWNGINHQRAKVQISYEYTDYPNSIHQEISSWQTPHFSYRGSFLGKYSSHLLKRAIIKENGGNLTMDFSYTFDAAGRVSEMLIKRSSPSIDVLYEYQY